MSLFLSFDSPNFNPSSLKNKCLILPIVSAANVPQLATDILIATFSLSRIGVFDPRYHIPIVGARESGEPGVTTPLELFGNDEFDFVVIQQRSPVLKTQKDAFVSAMIKFINEHPFKSVLFVTAIDSTYRTDAQLGIPLFQFVPPATKSSNNIQNTPLATLTSLLPPYTTRSQNDQTLRLPNGGLTKRFISAVSDIGELNAGFLIWMGMEGDNREDARLVANGIAKVLSVERKDGDWKYPQSWKQGLFGTPNDQTLYG